MKRIFPLASDVSAKERHGTLVAILFWPVAGLLITCAAWFLLLQSLAQEKRAIERSGYQTAVQAALAQANQTRKNLGMVDQILLMARVHVAVFPSKKQLSLFVGSLVPSGITLSINTYDTIGTLMASSGLSDDHTKRLASVSGEAFFSEQLRRDEDFLYIGIPPQQEGGERDRVQFSRKLFDKVGRFSGVVSVELEVSSLALSDSISLLGESGFVVALKPGDALHAVSLSEGKPPTVEMLRRLPDISGSERGSIIWMPGPNKDGESYFLGWQAVSNFPVAVVAAVERKRVFSFYSERERAELQTATGASIAMLLFVIAAAAVTARLEFQRHRLSQAQAAYRTATEHGSEGFIIAKPVRDSHGLIRDYVTTDCNQRGASFFYRSREALLGQTLSNFRQLLPLDVVMTKFASAIEFGYAEFTLKIMPEGRDVPWFMSAMAVKSDGVLAITLRDVTLEKFHLSSLERQANEDTLTGLPNRAWLTNTLPELVVDAEQKGKLLAVLFVDLDGFKSVNDTFGHAAGDELLKSVSRRLKVAVRPKDHVARIGGDEFVIILENLTDASEAKCVAERVVQDVKVPFLVSSGVATVGTSIGISVYPLDALDADTLLKHADIAMYSVKTTGKNRYQYFDKALFAEMHRKAQLEYELRTAITERQFVMYYQPRVDVLTSTVFSMEALIRWIHPVEGLLGPDHFIPIAEETGLILELGEMIIDIVCAQLAVWAECDRPVLPVSVNVSSRQFNEIDICDCIANALTRHGVLASCIEIELTESTMVKDPVKTSACINSLHNLGIRLLVDDFGTGYSSLAMLQDFDFDILKVDKSFTRRLGVDRNGEIFFGAIITMAHALGMRVIAEGVESYQQLEILQRLRCDEVQGFYLYRPLEAGKVQESAWSTD